MGAVMYAAVRAPTKTDAIAKAITEALEARRTEIDGSSDIRVLSLIVTLNQRTGKPLRVIYRTESQHDVVDG